jgi:gamma-glutamyltranspeptidase/glutathione hydrolase
VTAPPAQPQGWQFQTYGAAVVTPHALASQAAMTAMARGGNAVDAALAADAVLGVVAPETCGIGGDLFALVHRDGADRPQVLNASGRAGEGADPEKLRTAGHTIMPPFDAQAVTVPGCVDGWMALHERFGQMDWPDILEPSIGLARHGFPASAELAAALTARQDRLTAQTASEGLFPQGRPPGVGARLTRPGLASTLSDIAANGRAGFYQAKAGTEIVAATGGILTEKDLAKTSAEWVEPLAVEVFGLTGWTTPPNSQGYLTLASAALYELLQAPSDPEDPTSWHLAIEAYRAMAADRGEVLCDAGYAPVPPAELVSSGRLVRSLAQIDRDRAAVLAARPPAPGGTAYLCVVDAEGLGVSFIQSNFMGIGSGIGAGKAGFFLHNRGAGFDLRRGHPNELAPGKRPLHTLSPSIWTAGGRLAGLLGTRGGDYQPQLLLQMAIRVFGARLAPGAAQTRPRWMVPPGQSSGSEVAVEAHAPAEVVKGLERRGHRVTVRHETQHGWGPVSVITIDENGLRTAAADPRVDTAMAAVS